MEDQRLSYLQQIAPQDWERRTASVRKLVEEMARRIELLEKQLELKYWQFNSSY